jgi:hypothetical protein
MVALALTTIWRQIGSTAERVRLLCQEGFLWCRPAQVDVRAMNRWWDNQERW